VGLDPNIQSKPVRAKLAPPSQDAVEIDLESPIEGRAGAGNILCASGDKKLALLTINETPSGRVVLLNTHTYSQADFDAVGEVLLCPRPLGLLDIQGSALSTLREAFGSAAFEGPSCVTYHPFGPAGSADCVVQNFNDTAINVTVTANIQKDKPGRFVDGFSRQPIASRAAESDNRVILDLSIPARGRVWVQHVD
jgi:hypothetical protein